MHWSMEVDWDVWSPPKSFVCPISGELMIDPVTCVDGHSYEKGSILRRFDESRVTSPVTDAALASATVFPNHELRNAIEEWKLQLQGGGRPPGGNSASPAPPLPPPPTPRLGQPANNSPSTPATSRSHSVPDVVRASRQAEARARAEEVAEPPTRWARPHLGSVARQM